MKSAVAVAQKYVEYRSLKNLVDATHYIKLCGDEVLVPVAVEISYHHRVGSTVLQCARWQERAIAASQEKAQGPALVVARSGIAHGEIEITVTIEIRYCHRERMRANGHMLRRLEGTVPVAQ